MTETLLRLTGHMRWADALVADTLESIPGPDPEAVRLFAHIASVEHLWYARIQGLAPKHAVWPELSVGEARGVAAEHAGLFERLVRESDDDALARVIDYRNSAGKAYRTRARHRDAHRHAASIIVADRASHSRARP